MADEKLNWMKIDTNFSDKKLAKAYADLRQAFEDARAMTNAALDKFNPMMKAALVKAGEAEDADYIRISHRFGLQFAVSDVPEEPKGQKTKRRTVSV